LHDSQAAIRLATLTAGRLTNLYDLMDSAYDAPEIKQHSRSLGHVPIIDKNPRATVRRLRWSPKRGPDTARATSLPRTRYNERSAAERVNGRLKDDFGGRNVRVRGHAKVACQLMFGILALTCDQLLRLIN
jgi:IS5 family transposase